MKERCDFPRSGQRISPPDLDSQGVYSLVPCWTHFLPATQLEPCHSPSTTSFPPSITLTSVRRPTTSPLSRYVHPCSPLQHRPHPYRRLSSQRLSLALPLPPPFSPKTPAGGPTSHAQHPLHAPQCPPISTATALVPPRYRGPAVMKTPKTR